VTLRAIAARQFLANQGVAVRPPEKVDKYLAQHSDMVLVSMYVGALLNKEFNKDSKLYLERYCDPESSDESLVFYVRQQEYDPNIMRRIESIWEVYQPALENVSGWLLVTTDFRKPGK